MNKYLLLFIIIFLLILSAFVGICLYYIIDKIKNYKNLNCKYNILKVQNNDIENIKNQNIYKTNIDSLKALIQCITISCSKTHQELIDSYINFNNVLKKYFPNIILKCEIQKIGESGILIKYSGQNSDKPTLFITHYDTVNTYNDKWCVNPFEGIIENNELYGCGVINKTNLNNILSSINKLIDMQFVPNNDIYVSISGNQEIYGDDGYDICNYLQDNNIKLNLIIDVNGYCIANNFIPKNNNDFCIIGISEKGTSNIQVKIKNNVDNNQNINNTKITHMLSSIEKMLCLYNNDEFGPQIINVLYDIGHYIDSYFYRALIANLKCNDDNNYFECCIREVCEFLIKKTLNIQFINQMIKTNILITNMESQTLCQYKEPLEVCANLNISIGHQDNVLSVYRHIKYYIDDDNVGMSVLFGSNPMHISRTDNNEYNMIKDTIAFIYKNTCIISGIVDNCTDSRYYDKLCDNIYIINPIKLSQEEYNCINTIDEHVGIDAIHNNFNFYFNLIKKI